LGLLKEEIRNVYRSLNFIREKRWFDFRKLEGKSHSEDLVVDERTMFKVDLKQIAWEGDLFKIVTTG
jgi:tRNA G37 N-methylase Trm5